MGANVEFPVHHLVAAVGLAAGNGLDGPTPDRRPHHVQINDAILPCDGGWSEVGASQTRGGCGSASPGGAIL